jgi:hypothetical protein
MIVQQIVVVIVAVMINATICAILPTILYFVLKYPLFAHWLKRGIEDGDGVPHKQDLKDIVILFFASVFAWILTNVIFIWIFFDKELLVLVGVVTTIVTALFGISRINNHK